MTIRPWEAVFGGRNLNGGAGSSPFDTYIVCSIPSLESVCNTMAGRMPGRNPAGTGRGGRVGFGPGGASAEASVTAPSPGSPTAPRAAPPRPPMPCGPALAEGISAVAGRVTSAMNASAQPVEPDWRGTSGDNCFCHSMRPRSMSTAYTPLEPLPMNPRERNPRYPMYRSSMTGAANAPPNFTFLRNWKPGFSRLSFEIFASVRIQKERCASPPLVTQSAAPRPNCAFAAPIQTPKPATDITTILRITKPLLVLRFRSLLTYRESCRARARVASEP